MKLLILAFLLVPLSGISQKITRVVSPQDHSLWLLTDNASLKSGIGASILIVRFKVEGPSVYLYLWGNQDEISERDWAAFFLGADTIIAHSTGVQMSIGTLGSHEYKLDNEGLARLARHPVIKVIVSTRDRFQETDVPEKSQDKLMVYAAALLKEMGN